MHEEKVALRHQAAVDKATQQGRREGADAAKAALAEARVLQQELREKNAALVALSAKSASDAVAAAERLNALSAELRVGKQHNQREHTQKEAGALGLFSTPPLLRIARDTLQNDYEAPGAGGGGRERSAWERRRSRPS